MAGSPSGADTAWAAAAGAATTALQPAKPKAAPSLTALLRAAMPRAFVGLWMLDRDAARKDYAKLARAASRGAIMPTPSR